MSMNIFALKGHKVKVTEDSAMNGQEFDTAKVNKWLGIGEFTIEKTVIRDFHTIVHIQECPMFTFNSVNFEDVKKQSEANDKKHKQWSQFNPKK